MRTQLYVQRIRVPLLGFVRLAATSHGIVAVNLRDNEDTLHAELLHRFPDALIKGGNAVLTDAAREIRAYLAGGPHPDVEVVIPEKGFSARVWRQIARIPYGEVRSYGRIARALRKPQASRAVGQACGRNPVPARDPLPPRGGRRTGRSAASPPASTSRRSCSGSRGRGSEAGVVALRCQARRKG